MSRRKSKTRAQAKAKGYRSGFEEEIARQAEEDSIEAEYEPKDGIIVWQPKPSKYLPDFRLKNGLLIEAKGRLTQKDRTKLLRIKEQHPDIDIRLIFQYDNKLTTASKTRYSEWATKHGFTWAMKKIPVEWAQETAKSEEITMGPEIKSKPST